MRSSNSTAARARAVRGQAVALALLASLAAGCGSAALTPATAARPPASLPLGTSVAAAGVTWAVIPMGVPRGHNLFWQVLALPRGRQPVEAGHPARCRD